MRMRERFLCLNLLLSAFVAREVDAQTVEWTAGRVQGSGCDADDTSIFIFADEISYVFSNLGINLSAGRGPKALNKFCNIDATARVNAGNYVAEFQQVLSYGGIKTQWGSQAAISSAAHFFGHNIKPFRIVFANGEDFDQAVTSITLQDKDTAVARKDWWCRPQRNPVGKLKGRISVNGQLLGSGEGSVALSAQSFDLKYAATLKWSSC